MEQQEAARLKNEEYRNRQRRQKIEKENWEKKKKEFGDAFALIVKNIINFWFVLGNFVPSRKI